jgi:hypothetical protein
MSNEHVPVSLKRRVRLRAGDRCEYSRLSQVSQEATFHVDHVHPLAIRVRLTLKIDQVRVRRTWATTWIF